MLSKLFQFLLQRTNENLNLPRRTGFLGSSPSNQIDLRRFDRICHALQMHLVLRAELKRKSICQLEAPGSIFSLLDHILFKSLDDSKHLAGAFKQAHVRMSPGILHAKMKRKEMQDGTQSFSQICLP